MVIVRFKVGEDEERALVRLNQKLNANLDRIPPGASMPLVKPRSIDDVPILAVTLWGQRYDDFALRTLAAQVHDAVKEVPDVSEVTLIGGRPARGARGARPRAAGGLRARPAAWCKRALGGANVSIDDSGPGQRQRGSCACRPATGCASVEDVRHIGGVAPAGPRRPGADVAAVVDGDAEPTAYVLFHSREGGSHPAVTIAVAKRKGTNAIAVAHAPSSRSSRPCAAR